MKKFTIFSLLSIVLFTTAISASESEKEYKSFKLSNLNGLQAPSYIAKQPTIYKEECASCHMGYQAEFLPKSSWIKLMNQKNLSDHFGVDASLEENDRKKILHYLIKNAADSKYVGKYYKKFAKTVDPKQPFTISKSRYFIKEHRKIPKKLIKQKEVKTFANCLACHKDAEVGTYKEHFITIPNYGKWDD